MPTGSSASPVALVRARRRSAARMAILLAASAVVSACTADRVLSPIPQVDVGTSTAAIVVPRRDLIQPETAPAAMPEEAPAEQPAPDMAAPEEPAPMLAPAPAPEAAPSVEPPATEEAGLPPARNPSPGIAPPDRAAPRAEMPPDEVARRRELKRLGVTYVDLPPIYAWNGACRIDYPVKVLGLSGGVALKPAATLNTTLAVTFAKYVRRDFAPAVRWRYLSGINTIYTGSSYSCRRMIGESSHHISEHAKGNAIDVMKIRLDSGRVIDVEKPGWFSFRQRGFLNRVRAEACDYFTTVLGPGYNRAHANHFHFDLMRRRNGYVACR